MAPGMEKGKIGYANALQITLDTISPLAGEWVDLAGCSDRIAYETLCARVDSPSSDASMKDGYAVRSSEIRAAAPENKFELNVIDMAAAGIPARETITGNTAIRIQTGAEIPRGADAVLAEEFASRDGDRIRVFNNANPGRNILPKGADISVGESLVSRGSRLHPGTIGLLAAGGYSRLKVFRRPNVALIATGDELVTPGQPLPEGKLYASNIEIINAWCRRLGISTSYSVLKDKMEPIARKLAETIATHDAVITSGGAWTGDRDLVATTLAALGWKRLFHRIRMGPGKAVGFGVLNEKPVFLLPGGPPSNLMAFLQIALPGLLKLGGHKSPGLPRMVVRLNHELTGRNPEWTQFVYGTFATGDSHTAFESLRQVSRLKAMALAQGIVAIPEGVESLGAGRLVEAQLLI